MRLPPMSWYGGSTSEWTDKDLIMTLALTVYEDGMCSCGHPLHLCRHPSNDGWFEVKVDQCQARAATDRVTSVKGYKPEPGTALYTVYTRPADKPLPPFPTPKK